ncbi:peptidase C14, caspase domain-containing protein [Endogone sp. FLAS-F59071]|nr:peptidase C14, caspase domain-containing protein [Endogone sp. FLAS-F59071]|eukprot:RUS12462.1 peptidase C14, caspase domain-containing protein [Endogone sp. FLAS-F59071]
MRWLVYDAQPNDSFFFHYSGHGGQVGFSNGTTKDLDGDEDDGMDETIYPVDHQHANNQGINTIIDDEMHDIMVRPLPPGCRLTAIFDSCHSGTALDLPYIYSTTGVIKENYLKDAGQTLLTAGMDYIHGDLGLIGAVTSIGAKVIKGRSATEYTRQNKSSPADVIMFSGCKDSQTSADASVAGNDMGAMSDAFITAYGILSICLILQIRISSNDNFIN